MSDLFNPKRSLQPGQYPVSIHEEIEERVAPIRPNSRSRMRLNYLQQSGVLSVTQYPQVANSLSFWNSENRDESGYHLYLFALEMPEISLITQDGLFGEYLGTGQSKPYRIGNFEVAQSDLGVEIFVPFAIPQNEITSVDKIEETPPKCL